jgi:hypothetical protein
VQETTGEKYLIEDSVGNAEEISRENIISDEDDASNLIQVSAYIKFAMFLTAHEFKIVSQEFQKYYFFIGLR